MLELALTLIELSLVDDRCCSPLRPVLSSLLMMLDLLLLFDSIYYFGVFVVRCL